MKAKHLILNIRAWLVLALVWMAASTALVGDPAAPAPADSTSGIIPASDATPGPSVAGSDGDLSIVQPVATSTADQPMSDKLRKRRLFWAEPVTATGKNVPVVGPSEMKLVAVHGSVTVTTPDGQSTKGANGMLVPSGSNVASAAGSSAAVFMGGINSARIVPNSAIVVNQTMEGTVRHTTVDLQTGAVFSRVGKRAGETQSYEVRTPEGVAAARGTELMDAIINATFEGKVRHIHAVFVNKGTVDLLIGGKVVGTITGGANKIAMASMGTPKQTQDDLEKLLDHVLDQIQPFNVTTIQALFDYENGTATADELALIETELYGSVQTDGTQISLTAEDQQFLATAAASLQDLVPLHHSRPASNNTPPPDEPTSGR